MHDLPIFPAPWFQKMVDSPSSMAPNMGFKSKNVRDIPQGLGDSGPIFDDEKTRLPWR